MERDWNNSIEASWDPYLIESLQRFHCNKGGLYDWQGPRKPSRHLRAAIWTNKKHHQKYTNNTKNHYKNTQNHYKNHQKSLQQRSKTNLKPLQITRNTTKHQSKIKQKPTWNQPETTRTSQSAWEAKASATSTAAGRLMTGGAAAPARARAAWKATG